MLERYGMSETLLTLSNPLVGERRPGSVGRALPGAFVIAGAEDDLGIGELLVRGPMLFEGYWGRPDATAADVARRMVRDRRPGLGLERRLLRKFGAGAPR